MKKRITARIVAVIKEVTTAIQIVIIRTIMMMMTMAGMKLLKLKHQRESIRDIRKRSRKKRYKKPKNKLLKLFKKRNLKTTSIMKKKVAHGSPKRTCMTILTRTQILKTYFLRTSKNRLSKKT